MVGVDASSLRSHAFLICMCCFALGGCAYPSASTLCACVVVRLWPAPVRLHLCAAYCLGLGLELGHACLCDGYLACLLSPCVDEA